MKKITIVAFLLLSASFFYSCDSSGKEEVYTIKMRLNKGDTFRQDIKMNMLMNTSGIEMNMKMNTDNLFEVINNIGEEKEIKITYTKMDMAIDMGQLGNMVPDSIKNNTYDYMVGKSVILRLSKDNEITSVSGFNQILNVEDSASREMMKKMFSKDQLNSMFGIMFSMYPKKPVKIGESWTGATKVKMANLDMSISNKHKLIAVKNGLAEISIDGTIGGTGDMVEQSSGMKMDMNGTQTGTIFIRIDNGYLHNGSYKMDMKTEMLMMGQKIPMTMKADYTIKGI